MKRMLTDVKIVCDPPRLYAFQRQTPEDEARAYEEWVREFDGFIRDHRSQDPVRLSVEREYTEVCSFCESAWEWDNEMPGCCDEAIEEYERKHQALVPIYPSH